MRIVRNLAVLGMASIMFGAAAQAEKDDNQGGDGAWISVTGEMVEKHSGFFEIDYGGGRIEIRLAAFDDPGLAILQIGDWITVTGRLDERLYRTRRLQARSMFVPRLGTYYYASESGETGGYYAGQIGHFSVDDYGIGPREWLAVVGEVVRVGVEELTIDTGPRTMTIDTSDIDPAARPERGDRISVSGTMDYSNLFDDPEINAASVTLLTRG